MHSRWPAAALEELGSTPPRPSKNIRFNRSAASNFSGLFSGRVPEKKPEKLEAAPRAVRSRPICKKNGFALSSTGPKINKKSRPTAAKEGPRSGPFLRLVGRRFFAYLCGPVLLNGSTFLQIGRLQQMGSTKITNSLTKSFSALFQARIFLQRPPQLAILA